MKQKKNTKSTSHQRPKRRCAKKRRYRTRNWREYNASLVARGSLTLWIEQSVLEGWRNRERSGRRGASVTYSDAAIVAALSLRVVYSLPLRATQGLLASVLKLMGLEDRQAWPVPNYSTLCRRQKGLAVRLPRQSTGKAVHLVVDSTGCKIYGEGEWKVRQHGISKRRTWRKLHLAVDEATGEIMAALLSSNGMSDSEALPGLLDEIGEPIAQLSGDGGYDQRRCYDTLRERQEEQEHPIKVTIPPRRGARIWQHGNSKQERLARDENLRRIRAVGRAGWKKESGYHRRSLAETAVWRLKSRFGERLSNRLFETQATEAFVRCAALNKMTQLGMPDSYAV